MHKLQIIFLWAQMKDEHWHILEHEDSWKSQRKIPYIVGTTIVNEFKGDCILEEEACTKLWFFFASGACTCRAFKYLP